jgi:hypothetical protein
MRREQGQLEQLGRNMKMKESQEGIRDKIYYPLSRGYIDTDHGPMHNSHSAWTEYHQHHAMRLKRNRKQRPK